MAGFWSSLAGVVDTYDPAQRVLPDPYEPWGVNSGWSVADPGVPLPMYTKTAAETFWKTQPNVRKVIDFIARNVSTIPFHTHQRVSDDDRRRITDHPLPRLLSSPAPRVGPYRFWHAVLSDGLLYDKWACIYVPGNGRTPAKLVHVPSWRLHFVTDALRQVVALWYWVGDTAPDSDRREGWVEIPLETAIFDHGYAPRAAGLSPIVTLTDLLAEQAESVAYRRQVWANGARTPTWIERPLAAPAWGPPARNRFLTSFRAAFSGRGENAGGVPLMEDGMQLHSLDAMNPADTLDLEGRQLSAIEVCSAFHIAPELVGARQGNYSNVREYRQMLYRDSLGPYVVPIEQALNVQLLPQFTDVDNFYVEANVESKLRGSFEEQSQMMASSIGAPWLTRNEGRSLMNRGPVEGGDELVVPLNVLIGGQANPRDSGEQNEGEQPEQAARRPQGKAIRLKNRAPGAYETQCKNVLAAFFKRQQAVVLTALGAKAADEWWDKERWDRELADDLFRLANLVSVSVAAETLGQLGVSASEYDVDRTLAFLRAVSTRIAGNINDTTKAQLDATLAASTETDRTGALKNVFEVAESSRAEKAAVTLVTTYSAFGTTEAAKQVGGEQATKTWIVTSNNPRAEHAAMDGETVSISSKFSNGADWPGDSLALGADGVAGCKCDVIISLPRE